MVAATTMITTAADNYGWTRAAREFNCLHLRSLSITELKHCTVVGVTIDDTEWALPLMISLPVG
jgi:hypothetical protein